MYKMKTIGFIDLYISEWHAEHYPQWIKEACDELGYEYEVKYGWAEQYVSPTTGENTDDWCARFGVERCSTIEELCEKCDFIMILAPSAPGKHLEYARIALTYGKPTYIDKPFSDSVENAKAIFALSEKYNAPFFSSSALRYAAELDKLDNCKAVSTVGGGRALEEYLIHQIEMIVKKLGLGAKAIKGQKITDTQYAFVIKYDDDRRGAMHYVKANRRFEVTLSRGDGENAVVEQIQSDGFPGLIRDILTFFETGRISFDVAETMEVNKIMIAAFKAKQIPDTWVDV